ncbi:MAG: iron chelate uptake ABC transporter family permease subunit, partial [Mycetocola sp.]
MTSATGSTAGVIGGTRSRTRVVLCIVGVVLLLACVLVLSVLVGNKPISLEQFAAVLRGEGDPYLETVVASRIPRTVIGLIAGAALAVSGSLLQAV